MKIKENGKIYDSERAMLLGLRTVVRNGFKITEYLYSSFAGLYFLYVNAPAEKIITLTERETANIAMNFMNADDYYDLFYG